MLKNNWRKNKKFEELLVENQTLKEQMNLQSAQLPLNALNSNESADKHPAKPLKKVKKFRQKPDLNRHIEKQINYKCELCDKSFGQKETVHKKLRDYKYDICDKLFARKSYLNGHMKTHTKNEKKRKFKCDYILQ